MEHFLTRENLGHVKPLCGHVAQHALTGSKSSCHSIDRELPPPTGTRVALYRSAQHDWYRALLYSAMG